MIARNDKIKKRSILRYVSTFNFGNDTAIEQKVNFSRLPGDVEMELFCEKYKEKVDSENVRCHHPEDYCQHRQSCLIHFMEQENRRESERKEAGKKEKCKN